jgi:hypothetical protein
MTQHVHEGESDTHRSIEPVESVAIWHLKHEIAGGKHWYMALLESIAVWNTSVEVVEGRRYQYLIGGEAFDWLLLAERLCQPAGDLIPEAEKVALLFHGEPPLDLPAERFKEAVGEIKYHQYLNYFYGVTVEEALQLAVEEEVRKERWAAGLHRDSDNTNEAYRRIYGSTRTTLLRRFRRERGYPQLKSIGLTQLKEFTYWLFKLRVKQSDKAKTASDTKKGLDWLKGRVFSRWLSRRAFGVAEGETPQG